MAVLLSREDLRQVLAMSEVIHAVENGFSEYRKGRCLVPVRMPVRIDKADGIFLYMPAYLEKVDSFGTKMISVFPENLKRGISTLQSIYVLNDPQTGQLLAIMDGIFLTGVRTGATSGVATKHLAREDSTVLGIIGTGAQAPFQAEAICAVRPIQRILAYDKVIESAQRLSREASKILNVPLDITNSPREVVMESDILVTVTTSSKPVFDGKDLRPGTHINAVGAYTPEMREVDEVTVRSARIVVDTYEGCMAEAGDLLIPIKEGQLSRQSIHADLGEIVLGKKPGRTKDDEITLFESVGFALEDLVTARLAYHSARARGIGLEFSLGDGPKMR
jgi:alanine dehydrogenase